MSRLFACICLVVCCLLAAQASADKPAASASAAAKLQIPLPPLPKLKPIDYPPAAADAVQNLDARLDELLNTAIGGPLDEIDEKMLTAELDASIVPAIRRRIERLRDDIDGRKARDLLERARKAGRKAIKAHAKKNKLEKSELPDGDWLVFIMALGDSDDATWRDSVQLYGILRMLEAVSTTGAMRQMVACYSYFGELVRIDLQRAIGRMKDKSVAALMEATKHDARKVRRWARRQLDALGRAIPGEAVSTTDPDVLADILRAFGRVRDVDATRVVLSFANSERVQLRQAAREAIAAIGKPAWGHYKDVYKTLTGEKPPRKWDWERTVRELFSLHDRARLAQVYELWSMGKQALSDEKWSDATAAFDKVLARAPLFESRSEMAPAYFGHASTLMAEGKDDDAQIALRKALRLTKKGDDTNKIESRLAHLEGKALIAAGTPDRHILQRAIELDADNAEAKRLLASLEEKAEARQSRSKQYIAAAGIGVLAIVLLLLLWRRPRPRQSEEA